MRFKPIIVAAMALALTAPGIAQETASVAPAATDQQPDMERAGMIFSTFVAAVQNPELPDAEKNALIGCLYNNTLQTVSRATGEMLVKNPQIDATDPVNVYLVAAIVCGAREPGSPDGDAAATPAG